MRFLRTLIGAAAIAVTPVAWGEVSLQVYNQFGDYTDRGEYSAMVSTSEGRVDCNAPVKIERDGNVVTLGVNKVPGGHLDDACTYQVFVRLGTLPVGEYEVRARVIAIDGQSFEGASQTISVVALNGRCNPYPDRVGAISVIPKAPADTFIARVGNDASYAARLGNPVVWRKNTIGDVTYVSLAYPPLIDPPVILNLLNETGEFFGTSRNDQTFCFSVSPPAVYGQMVEFYNGRLDHYFYTQNAGEIAAIEAGKVGPNWARTGKQFEVTIQPYCGDTRYGVAYRFAGIPGKGPDSHFFTRDRAECYAIDKSSQWLLEGVPFYARAVEPDGTCASGVPLYRAWRPFGDSNHRFTTDLSVIGEMVARGWVNEGVAMCL